MNHEFTTGCCIRYWAEYSGSIFGRRSRGRHCKFLSLSESGQSKLKATRRQIQMVDLTMVALESALSRLPAGTQARVLLVAADVSQEEDTVRYVSETMKRWGRLDVSMSA